MHQQVRQSANSVFPQRMKDIIAELYEISCNTNLNLWWYLVTFLFQSCSDLIVLEKKMKAFILEGELGPGTAQLQCSSAITL